MANIVATALVAVAVAAAATIEEIDKDQVSHSSTPGMDLLEKFLQSSPELVGVCPA